MELRDSGRRSSPAAPRASARALAERVRRRGRPRTWPSSTCDGARRPTARRRARATGHRARRRRRPRGRRGRGLVARHRGPLRPHRPVRVERRHRHRRRRRGARRGVGPDLGGQRAGPRLRRPGRAALHARPRRGLPAPTASAAGLLTQIGDAPVLGHQARRRRPGRVARHHLRRPGHHGVVPVPAGRAHRHAARRGRTTRRRRSCWPRAPSSPRTWPTRWSQGLAPSSS